MDGFQLEDPAATLALQQALAFVDACDLGSDDERDHTSRDLDALLADVPVDGLFDATLEPLKPLETPPVGQFTGLMLESTTNDSDHSLDDALAALTTQCEDSGSDGSGDGATRTKKSKRARAPSPVRAVLAPEQTAADAPVKKPTKKRVRRQREELLYLRVKVKEMESSLAELREKDRAKANSPSNGQPSLLASVWQSLANRQYKDRERAEQENRKLKATLEGQLKLAKCLEEILEDQPDGDAMPSPPRPEQTKLLTLALSSDQTRVHTQLRSELESAFNEVDAKYKPSKFSELEKEKFDVKVAKSLDNGIALQFIGFKRVPFTQEVAARGMWRFTSHEASKQTAYFYEQHDTSSTHTIARTFGHKIETDNASLDYRLENVMECRKRGERIVILSRSLAKPIKFSAAPVNGIRFHENGWLVIERASAKDGSARGKWATISSCMELRPIFDDDAPDQDFTVGALTNFVIDSFHRNMHVGEDLAAAIMMDEAQKVATQPGASPWL